jgi:hypothetical protein
MANQRPFQLDQPLPITRGSDGRFREIATPQEGPENPLVAAAAGSMPKAWAPGIGQGTMPTRSPVNPYPPANPGNRPYKFGVKP